MSFHHLDATTLEQRWVASGVGTLDKVDEEAFEERRSIISLAAHPDDEALGCAGLLKSAEHNGTLSSVILFTDGEGSDPNAPTCTAGQRAEVRKGERDSDL